MPRRVGSSRVDSTSRTTLPEVKTIGNKVLIDTGAGYGGVLTALLLPEFEVIQV